MFRNLGDVSPSQAETESKKITKFLLPSALCFLPPAIVLQILKVFFDLIDG
ncbi:MAG: hypothetical protein CLLPBCKN_005193 [Chroococcidiopsis cubana SAG 39.79]|nr:hypothetical protein [Chroococcidiopsis cubana SAG 39.79]